MVMREMKVGQRRPIAENESPVPIEKIACVECSDNG